MKSKNYIFCILIAIFALKAHGQVSVGLNKPSFDLPFPRLMGMNIGAKNYDDRNYQQQLARLNLVILGFYKGWKPAYGIEQVVHNLKQLSGGKILVGQYTVLNECQDNPKSSSRDVQSKLHQMNWWARDADGRRVQWTSQFEAWDINFTAGSKADDQGLRYPEWLAQYNDRILFKSVPFDFWFCDNVMFKPRVKADWTGSGTNQSPADPAVGALYRAGHRAEWDQIRKIHPGICLMGNIDGDLSQSEYTGQLEGAFLEGLMGKSWSIENRLGWSATMNRYRATLANTRDPHVVGFNVHGRLTDYRFFRYAYASCLMDDGFFCFTDSDKEYSSVPWFDEFNFKLGAALSKPPTCAWQKGVWRRDFKQGVALVNPTAEPVTVNLEPGFARLHGSQAPDVNSGASAVLVKLGPQDGIILQRQ